jgi:ubiquinone/menaquinone biosynthesis C-methylase UbiE
MKQKIKNLKYSKSNISKLAGYDRIKEGLKNINLKKVNKILDLGSGAGQVLYAINKLNYSGYYLGIDSDFNMINKSKKFYKKYNYKNFRFKKTEIQNFKTNDKFDLILIWGVISFFDNYKYLISKILRYLNKNGVISIFSGFSENDYNIFVKYKKKNEKNQSGLNMHSINDLEDYFKEKGFSISKKKFVPSVNLKKTKNPLGSYILYDDKKNKFLVNNLNIVRKFYFLKAKKL